MSYEAAPPEVGEPKKRNTTLIIVVVVVVLLLCCCCGLALFGWYYGDQIVQQLDLAALPNLARLAL